MRLPNPSHLQRLAPWAAALGASIVLAGCVVAPAQPYYATNDAVVYTPAAPPPMQSEIVTVAPSPVHVWIGGYWDWSGGRYQWRPGRWEAPPHRGYRWVPRQWDHGSRGWYPRGGHWGR
ncbi:hypothetical protein GCM10027082_03740 [Comamonas humi]